MTKLERKLLLAVAKLLQELVFWKNIDRRKAYELIPLIKAIEEEDKS